VKGEVDVQTKRCAHPKCDTQPIFAFPGCPAARCYIHKLASDVDVKHQQCRATDCKTRAVIDGFCTLCHPQYEPSTRGASKIACAFLDELTHHVCRSSPPTAIMHKHYETKENKVSGREHRVNNTRYHADGFLRPDECKPGLPFVVGKAGLVIEFHGHLWHGHPNETLHNEINFCGARCGDLYEQTMERMHAIKDEGYTVIYIWESDFAAYKRSDSSKSLLDFCSVL
jgi:G:T-mismatch repair DNA endonuclease (very short patch repair protein)